MIGLTISISANAAIIDTITVTSSKIIEGGESDRDAYVDRLLIVPSGAIVESFTFEILTSIGTKMPQSIGFLISVDPLIGGGHVSLPGIGIPVHVTSGFPGVFDLYSTLFGFVSGSGVDMPEETVVDCANDGQTSFKGEYYSH